MENNGCPYNVTNIQVLLNGKKKLLKTFLQHFSYFTCFIAFQKQNKFSEIKFVDRKSIPLQLHHLFHSEEWFPVKTTKDEMSLIFFLSSNVVNVLLRTPSGNFCREISQRRFTSTKSSKFRWIITVEGAEQPRL